MDLKNKMSSYVKFKLKKQQQQPHLFSLTSNSNPASLWSFHKMEKQRTRSQNLRFYASLTTNSLYGRAVVSFLDLSCFFEITQESWD